MKKCAIIFNPESGKPKDKKNIKEIPSILEINGYESVLCPTKGPKDATNIVENLSDDVDLVICCGGDGTLNEGITGNMKRDKKLLMTHLPVGTVNDVGTMYGFTKNMIVNTQMLVSGVVKNIDVCLINEKPFVYVACVGSYVDVSYNTPRNLKKKYGRLGYIFNALSEFKDKIKLFDLTYEIDGKKVSGTYSFVFVTNTCRLGGFNNIYSDVKLDDDMFEVVLCTAKSKAELIKIGGKIIAGEIKNMPGLEYYKTNNFKVTFDKMPPSWVIDGEEFKHKTREFSFSINKDINMLIPKKNVVKLFSSLGEYSEKSEKSE
jgi:YegS/Rv2252/BmrU family lipid kinase